MQSRGLLVALGLFVLLAGGIWWSNKKQAADAAKAPADTTTKILSLTESDITKVEVRRVEGESTSLDRQPDNTWKLTASTPPAAGAASGQAAGPVTYPADKESASSLVNALTSLNADKVIEEKPTNLAEFGLDKPKGEVVVSLKSGKTRTLSLGEDTPVGGGAFVRIDGDARVFTIASWTKTSLDKKAADLRDKRLLTFDSDKLVRVELAAKAATLEFARNAQNEWTILKPKPMRADGWQVDELVRRLKDMKLDATLTEDQRKDMAKQFASAAPLASASVTDAAGTQKIEVRKSKENKFYGKSSAVDGFWLIEEAAGNGLDKKPEDFRSKKIFDFGFSDPTKVEYKDGTRTVAVNKAGDRWLQNNKPMDNVGVQSLIDRLRDLSATKFPETGFAKADIELTVVSKDGKLTEKAALSKSGNTWIARREGEPALYEIDTKAVEDLQKAAADVKEQPPEKAAPAKK